MDAPISTVEISQLDREKMIDDCNREIAEINNEFEMLKRSSFSVGEKVTSVNNVPASTSEGNTVAAVKAASIAVSAAPVVPTRNSNTTTLFT